MTTVTVPEPLVAAPPTSYWTGSRKAGAAYLVVGLAAVVFWGMLAKHAGTAGSPSPSRSTAVPCRYHPGSVPSGSA